jgi:hypothetical protein
MRCGADRAFSSEAPDRIRHQALTGCSDDAASRERIAASHLGAASASTLAAPLQPGAVQSPVSFAPETVSNAAVERPNWIEIAKDRRAERPADLVVTAHGWNSPFRVVNRRFELR